MVTFATPNGGASALSTASSAGNGLTQQDYIDAYSIADTSGRSNAVTTTGIGSNDITTNNLWDASSDIGSVVDSIGATATTTAQNNVALTNAYTTTFGRQPDAAGFAFYLSEMGKGNLKIKDVKDIFSRSGETTKNKEVRDLVQNALSVAGGSFIGLFDNIYEEGKTGTSANTDLMVKQLAGTIPSGIWNKMTAGEKDATARDIVTKLQDVDNTSGFGSAVTNTAGTAFTTADGSSVVTGGGLLDVSSADDISSFLGTDLLDIAGGVDATLAAEGLVTLDQAASDASLQAEAIRIAAGGNLEGEDGTRTLTAAEIEANRLAAAAELAAATAASQALLDAAGISDGLLDVIGSTEVITGGGDDDEEEEGDDDTGSTVVITGTDGTDGTDGATGITGTDGVDGIDGIDGINGTNGTGTSSNAVQDLANARAPRGLEFSNLFGSTKFDPATNSFVRTDDPQFAEFNTGLMGQLTGSQSALSGFDKLGAQQQYLQGINAIREPLREGQTQSTLSRLVQSGKLGATAGTQALAQLESAQEGQRFQEGIQAQQYGQQQQQQLMQNQAGLFGLAGNVAAQQFAPQQQALSAVPTMQQIYGFQQEPAFQESIAKQGLAAQISANRYASNAGMFGALAKSGIGSDIAGAGLGIAAGVGGDIYDWATGLFSS